MSRGFNLANTAAVLAQTRMNQRASRSPADNKEQAYQSSIGKTMRKKNLGTTPIAGKDLYSSSSQKAQLKLAFLILTYLYSQDDQKLSKKELKDLKEVIKKEAPEFTSDDLIEVYGFFKILPDANYVLKYISDNNIQEESFYAANDLVLSSFNNKKVYMDLLKELRRDYKLYA